MLSHQVEGILPSPGTGRLVGRYNVYIRILDVPYVIDIGYLLSDIIAGIHKYIQGIFSEGVNT